MAKEKLKEYEGNGDNDIDWKNESLVLEIIRGLINLPKDSGVEVARELIQEKMNAIK